MRYWGKHKKEREKITTVEMERGINLRKRKNVRKRKTQIKVRKTTAKRI